MPLWGWSRWMSVCRVPLLMVMSKLPLSGKRASHCERWRCPPRVWLFGMFVIQNTRCMGNGSSWSVFWTTVSVPRQSVCVGSVMRV